MLNVYNVRVPLHVNNSRGARRARPYFGSVCVGLMPSQLFRTTAMLPALRAVEPRWLYRRHIENEVEFVGLDNCVFRVTFLQNPVKFR